MHGESSRWSHRIYEDLDGYMRLEIEDEDGVAYPVGRRLTPGQAEKLVSLIAREASESRRPVKVVIRDPSYMAAIVLTVKRQPI